MTEEKPVTGELEMAEYMDRLEDGSLARESVKTALTARDARKLAGDILEQYQGLLKEAGPDITRGQKGELMDKAMESAFSKAPKGRAQQYGETLRGCKEAFMDISPVEMVHSSSVQMYRTIKLGFLMGKAQMDPSTQAGREQRQAIDRALEDRNFMETWQAAANQANASEKSRSVGTIAVDRGNEVSSRKRGLVPDSGASGNRGHYRPLGKDGGKVRGQGDNRVFYGICPGDGHFRQRGEEEARSGYGGHRNTDPGL